MEVLEAPLRAVAVGPNVEERVDRGDGRKEGIEAAACPNHCWRFDPSTLTVSRETVIAQPNYTADNGRDDPL